MLPFAGAVLTTGVATAVALWIVWWLTHLPGVGTGVSAGVPLLLVTFPVATAAVSRLAGKRLAIRVGAFGGIAAGLLTLVVLGSLLGSPPDGSAALGEASAFLRQNVPATIAGFLAVCALLGTIGGLTGRALASGVRQADARTWLARLSAVAAASFLPLLVAGGAVTSTESGMAVTDPIVDVLYPIELMAEPRVFIEHSHRLVGALIGLTVLAMAIYATFAEPRGWAKGLAWAAFAAVCLQGVLGIVRVDRGAPDATAAEGGLGDAPIAMLHGISAQLVFALAVVTAAALSTLHARPDPSHPTAVHRAARLASLPAALLGGALLFQLSTGAMSRHLHSSHAIWTHAVFALAVFLLAVVAALFMRSADRFSRAGAALRRVGGTLGALVFVQFVLGLFALMAVGGGSTHAPIPLETELTGAHPIRTLEALFTTAHQTTGALLIAACTLSIFWTQTLRRAEPGGLPADADRAPATVGSPVAA